MASEYHQTLWAHESPDCTARSFAPLSLFKRGYGSTVVDSEGMEYVDVCASFGSLALGHNHPEVKEAMVSYLQSDGLMQGMEDVYARRIWS